MCARAVAPVFQQAHGIALQQLAEAHPHALVPAPLRRAQPKWVHHIVSLTLQPVLRLSELREDLPSGKPCNLACDINSHCLTYFAHPAGVEPANAQAQRWRLCRNGRAGFCLRRPQVIVALFRLSIRLRVYRMDVAHGSQQSKTSA